MIKTEIMKRYEAETGASLEEAKERWKTFAFYSRYIAWLEAKAAAYDRLMSGGKKTLKEWANFLGMAVAVDRDGAVWAYPYRPVRYCNIWGSDEETWPSGAFEMPENLVDFNGEWKDSLTLPDEWEAM
jgi:hypothetical protein